MTFGESISTCFGKYATFSGRASRSEFWWFALFATLVDIALSLVSELLVNMWSLATLLPYLAVAWRRLHDIDRTGLWAMAPLIALAVLALSLSTNPYQSNGGLVFYGSMIAVIGLVLTNIIFWASEGTLGRNRYGENPWK